MLTKFKSYDKQNYGHKDKTIVLEALFDEFPPIHKLPKHSMQNFWDNQFPACFTINPNTFNILNAIKREMKVAIITNGSTLRQKAKIFNTYLHRYFNLIIISEEVGMSKPDKRIFELALKKLEVQPKSALFVGDDFEKDIAGCQNAYMKGIWFNPDKNLNNTEIKPYAEIYSLDQLVSFIE